MSRTTTLPAIFDAARLLRRHMDRTPLHHYPGLSEVLGAEVYVKHENYTAIGSFKIRGGLNTMARLTEEQRKSGVIIASSGNFGQAVAYGGRTFGVKSIIALPLNPNPTKAEAIRNFGGELLLIGKDYDEARAHIQKLAAEKGYHHFNDAEDPDFIAGLGTCMLEILEDLPEAEVVIVPVGGAGFASGICIAGKGIKPEVEIIGVSSEAAQSPYLSWREGRLIDSPMTSFAEGIAVRVSFQRSQEVIRELLDDFILVSEEEIRRAIVLMLEKTHNLAEGAGAASLAAAVKLKGRIKGRKTVLILSGGNISLEHLKEVLAVGPDGAVTGE
ncbi:MAG: threonine/serine dehydratase [Chloroflexi bacterium]|nr:threonine/serine dehydratase [Chloroflexota bacterium]